MFYVEVSLRVYRCLAEELAFHGTEQVVQKIAFNLVRWNEAHDAVWEASSAS